MNINKTRIKKLKQSLEAQLDFLLNKYSAKPETIECEKMEPNDYQLYVALDDNIQLYREILGDIGNVTVVENRTLS